MLGLERAERRRRAPGRDFGAHRLERRGTRAALRRLTCKLAPGGVLDDRRPSDRGGDRPQDGLETATLDHQPLEALVNLGAPLEHRVLLVDEQRERALGDRDERHLVRHLEQGHVALLRLVDQRLRQPLVLKPGAETETRDVVVGKRGDEAALPRDALELDAGREQQLASRKPRGGVVELRDVHPPDRPVGPFGSGAQLEATIRDQAADGQHRLSRGAGWERAGQRRCRRA